MKIIIKKNGSPIRIFHDSREVIVRPKAKKVEIFNSDGTLLENYELVDKSISWLEDPDSDSVEIVLTLQVTT